MPDDRIDRTDFTEIAWENFYNSVDDPDFQRDDAGKIFESLSENLKAIPFGDYFKRYIHRTAGMTDDYQDVPLSEYQQIIKDSFEENCTPVSFEPTTARLSALSKNWLTQQTVRRSVVFLLGFGLRMSVDDVNGFLEKALHEHTFNPKDPFEVICWYCFRNGLTYPTFKSLLERYNKLEVNTPAPRSVFDDRTTVIRTGMQTIRSDDELMNHLAKLKSGNGLSRMSVSSELHFRQLYNEARICAATIMNNLEEERFQTEFSEYRDMLLRDNRVSDEERIRRLNRKREEKRHYCEADVTEADFEHIICSAVPIGNHGNLMPSKASSLNHSFYGKRFSRQHINDLLSKKVEVDRFDLITLNFFIFSQKLDRYQNKLRRYDAFMDSTNSILADCSLGELYVANPYESFILMCMLSDDPLGTYADVLELSYQQ
ncbi:MAG: hypothetical protein LUH18_08040 [Oscillospiraceae bacterium]|nr:hypothetical protein [Oscillospiraceae bacterium]